MRCWPKWSEKRWECMAGPQFQAGQGRPLRMLVKSYIIIIVMVMFGQESMQRNLGQEAGCVKIFWISGFLPTRFPFIFSPSGVAYSPG
jgi:hypothetical protein